MNENINLYEILKDCPKDTEFYCSDIDENVKFKGIWYGGFHGVVFMPNGPYGMVNDNNAHYHICVNRYGSVFSKGKTPIIFPSKDQRDWSKWQCPKPKKPKFDPKTLHPFDKVLARIDGGDAYCWFADFVSTPAIEKYDILPCIMSNKDAEMIIPYNEDTKHLVGTSDEAPEYYRYWED